MQSIPVLSSINRRKPARFCRGQKTNVQWSPTGLRKTGVNKFKLRAKISEKQTLTKNFRYFNRVRFFKQAFGAEN